ncbi:hypothetical protein H8F21_16190 [Pseudomonas sp. P66]|uniref:Uncharacterized protein n=1 Tax=Pseudomonas arcuscaelestis TaxID=2710591 RepID=A0ABS2C213_9PSED|nr:hypothetical protein [Pseudomonas arcuscaelestis]MBM5459109.1 hypothetical protein [Pseudomonas arcuscaelestis]
MNPSSITSTLEENSRKQELELRQAEQSLSVAHEHTLKLEHSILEGLREVSSARSNSPTVDTQGVVRELDERRAAEAKLRRDLQGVEISIGSLNAMGIELSQRIESVKSAVSQALAVDRNYLVLLQQHESARRSLAAYQEHKDEIANECNHKLAVFNRQPVFSYLLKAGYGTERYKGRLLVKALDGWLAGEIDFHANAKNYRMLLAMQTGNEDRIATLSSEARVALEMVEQAAQRSYASAGLGELTSRLRSVSEKIAVHKKEANWFHSSLGKFAHRTDDHTKRAEELILNSLPTRSFDEIQALVKQSTAAAGDQETARVTVLQRELAEHHKTLPALEKAREQAEARYNKAKTLERVLRTDSYTRAEYYYQESLNLDSLISRYMAGNITASTVSAEVDRHRKEYAATSSGSDSGGYFSFADSGSDSCGGGDGGGGGGGD